MKGHDEATIARDFIFCLRPRSGAARLNRWSAVAERSRSHLGPFAFGQDPFSRATAYGGRHRRASGRPVHANASADTHRDASSAAGLRQSLERVMSSPMPVVFVGHGSPMNAIEDNVWSRGFRDLGASLPPPTAFLVVSAHWYIGRTALTGNAAPETIHDFGGFPDSLYEVRYPAKGDPGLAQRVVDLLGGGTSIRLDWGLDHGTWSVLCHLRPEADCPVVQLSINADATASRHVEIGRTLAPLRDEGVLILGSGNIVHNLGDAMGRMRSGDLATPAWAAAFDAAVVSALDRHDTAELARLIESPEGRRAHPTPDHYLPLLYAAGAAGEDPVTFPITGFDLGSLSMRSVLWRRPGE